MNYKGVLIENISIDTIKVVQESMSPTKDFILFNRKTIDTPKRNPSDLDKLRNDFDFLVYYSTNPDLTKWACQDQRIDCLLFPLSEIHQLADDSTIMMAKENDKAIEIDFSGLLSIKNPIPWLRNIKKVFHRAAIKKIPLLLSAYAQNEYALRSGYSKLGFLRFLDISEEYYEEISQIWLRDRLTRNRERKGKKFLSPGIWEKEAGESNQ